MRKNTKSIWSLLPVGKENRISTKQLLKISGILSSRELQERIASERAAGSIICSSTSGGYFIPKDKKELEEFCKAMEKRAKNTLLAIQSAKRALNDIQGQQSFSYETESEGNNDTD